VYGSGVWDFHHRIYGWVPGFRVLDWVSWLEVGVNKKSGFRIRGSGCEVRGGGFRVQGFSRFGGLDPTPCRFGPYTLHLTTYTAIECGVQRYHATQTLGTHVADRGFCPL